MLKALSFMAAVVTANAQYFTGDISQYYSTCSASSSTDPQYCLVQCTYSFDTYSDEYAGGTIDLTSTETDANCYCDNYDLDGA